MVFCRHFRPAIPALFSPLLQLLSGLLQTEGHSFCDLASLTFLCVSQGLPLPTSPLFAFLPVPVLSSARRARREKHQWACIGKGRKAGWEPVFRQRGEREREAGNTAENVQSLSWKISSGPRLVFEKKGNCYTRSQGRKSSKAC